MTNLKNLTNHNTKNSNSKLPQTPVFLILLAFVICVSGLTLTGCKSRNKNNLENTVFGVEDFTGKKIGVQLGTTGDIYASDYEDKKTKTVVERYNKGADAISSLVQGKIDCVIIDEEPAKAYISNNPTLMILDEPMAVEDYAAVIDKDNNELLSSVNAALEELQAEGIVNKIVNNYIADEKTGETTEFHYEQTVTKGEELHVSTNATFPPYEYYENGEIVGIEIDLAKAIADKLNRVLVIDDIEFDAIINAVDSGKTDIGMAGFTVTEERKEQISFSTTYATSKQVIIVRDNDSNAGKSSIKERFKSVFVEEGRWKFLVQGLLHTILITFCSLIIGSILGFLIALIRVTYDMNGTFKVPNILVRIYVTIIRGTPMMVQLLIIYFVIFASVDINKIVVAIIAFGINSSAYLSEVIRSGIMSIPKGQFEAGKSLGISFFSLMIHIILPQAIKNVLPAIGNEFISLLKETSISGYIGLLDLTRGGDIIRGVTYESFIPLITVAIIYLIMVLILTRAVKRMENYLKKNER
ncbi:MAG: ABC transporter permease subunit [Lachnospiraceae bacterium]|nr:ABC transporter permease subunit [Lachnospiraceae bacterium]